MALFRTFDGTLVNVYDIPGHVIRIDTVAHALSQLNRYGGHVPYPYSVAVHSVLVSYLVPSRLAYEGLMHDATEAFGLVDVPSGVKDLCPEYRTLECLVRKRIAPTFRLAESELDEVTAIDRGLARQLEQHFLQGQPLPPDATGAAVEMARRYCTAQYSWEAARTLFLARYKELAPR